MPADCPAYASPLLYQTTAHPGLESSISQLTGIAANRNGSVESTTSILKNLNSAKLDSNAEVVVSPPALYLLLAREVANDNIGVAAQNVFDKPNGAFTGEITVDQLKDAKINWTLTGHSERRVILKESDEVCLFNLLV